MTVRSDDELMTALADGETPALAELFIRHHRRVRSLCYRMTGDRQTAEDLAQESFLRVLRLGGSFGARAAFTTWLYRLVRNVCLDHLQGERRRQAREDKHAAEETVRPAMPTPADPRLDTVRAALYALPPDKREVLVLSRYEGLSYAEIAEVCETTEGAVKVRAHRAMRELRRRFEELERSR